MSHLFTWTQYGKTKRDIISAKKLIRKAKMFAASQDKSLSELLREAIEGRVSEQEGYAKARRRQMKFLRIGLNLGTRGQVAVSREQLHERE